MKTKHTPGPYEVRIHDKGPYFTEVEIWHQNYGLIARMPDHTSMWYSEKDEAVAIKALDKIIATAHVLAASTEMLEALQDVLNMCNDTIEQGLEFDHSEVKRNIEPIIQKATS